MKPKCFARNCAIAEIDRFFVLCPHRYNSPWSGFRMQPKIERSVVLPDPDGPLMMTIRPLSRVRWVGCRGMIVPAPVPMIRDIPSTLRMDWSFSVWKTGKVMVPHSCSKYHFGVGSDDEEHSRKGSHGRKKAGSKEHPIKKGEIQMDFNQEIAVMKDGFGGYSQ